jgi:protein-tyrosine phosphatase
MKNGRCLVHCVQGISRSASVVIAYVIASENKSFEEAHRYVKEKRPLIKPNDGFAQQLQEYEKLWRKRNKENITLSTWVKERNHTRT